MSSLRAFDASARHLSFSNAATELNLSPTAISHRIKELETALSVRLFERTRTGVTLTESGRRYLAMIRPALGQIAIASDTVSSARDGRLHISCLNAFAARCLLPALPDFCSRYPDIPLRIKPIGVTDDSLRVDFDVAIWHGMNDWPGFVTEMVGLDYAFPVCSPAFLARSPGLRTPSDLGQHTILRTISPTITDEWPAWLQGAGFPDLAFTSEIHCDSLFLSLEAAESGLGVCIGRQQVVRNDLGKGRLVSLFAQRAPVGSAYYLVTRPERTDAPKVVAFREWLLRYVGDRDDRHVAGH